MAHQELLCFITLIGFLLLLFAIEHLFRSLKMRAEKSRMIAHMATVISSLSFPYLFNNHWYILFLSLVFTVLLMLSTKSSYLNSIHGVSRRTIGSQLLPLSIYLTFLIAQKMESKYLYIIPFSIMAVSDPLAAYIGGTFTKYNREIVLFSVHFKKTILGSVAFFVSSLFISLVLLRAFKQVFDSRTFFLAILIALTGTIGELLSPNGTDNISVPLVLVSVLIFFY
jgi:phytol kinase